MEKEIGKVSKNPETDIVVRVDDFGGKRGLTIREYVTSERYTGFTKAGTRISPENFDRFKEIINSIDPNEMKESGNEQASLPDSKPKEEKKDSEDVSEEDLL